MHHWMITTNTWRKNTLETPDNPQRWQVLVDLNLLLDVFMNREPFVGDAASIWSLVETGQIKGFVAGHSLTTLFYLFRRQSSIEDAYQIIQQMVRVFEVTCIDRKVISQALDLKWRDFEDAVQAISAIESGCDYLITRNPQDYRNSLISVIQPADFLAVWSSRTN
jgi:predicted nucleic acid-binding protein